MTIGRRALHLAVLATLGCTGRCAPEPSAPGEPGSRPYPGAEERTVADIFGLNEAVSVPEAMVARGSVQTADLEAHLAADIEATVALGARHVRLNSATWPFPSWYHARRSDRFLEDMDRWVLMVQGAGLEPLVVLGPWPGNRTATYTDRYLPEDMAEYIAWVEALVERYDGDGVDDAPGLLRPVRTWEVDNEPDLHNRAPPRGGGGRADPEMFQTPAEYAEVFLATARAIRSRDPAATVLTGGIFSMADPHGSSYLEEVLARPDVLEAADGVSIHPYFHERRPLRLRRGLHNALRVGGGKPVWLTEAGVPSERPGATWVDEEWQARMVALVFGEALAWGVHRVYWHSLNDPPAGAPRAPFSSHSLLMTVEGGARPVFEEKPAAQVYRRLAELLGDVPLGEVELAAAAGGRAVRLGDMWLVYEGEGVALSGGPGAEGVVTDLLTGRESYWSGRVDSPAVVRRSSPRPPRTPGL